MITSILVVEGDELLRIAWASISRAFPGWNFTIIPSGSEALIYLAANKPDIILLDYLLPGEKNRGGVAVLKMIKADTTLQGIPIIMVSGYDRDEERNLALEAGADDFMPKPFRIQDLFEKIQDLLTKSQ